MGITKLNTGLYYEGREIYFCYMSDEYWFQTKYKNIDVLTKDMINFAHKIIWSNEWN